MRDVESCEGQDPRAIAVERHESGILREQSFDSVGENMEPVQIGKKFFHGRAGNYIAIVEPSANTAGVTIRTGMLFSSVLYTGTTKPIWGQSRTFPVLFKTIASELTTIPYSISIPAGVWPLA